MYSNSPKFEQLAFGIRIALKKAFKNLRKEGVIARMNFSCCGSCGGYYMSEKMVLDEKKIGYVFYHNQEHKNLPYAGYVYLNFGGRTDGTSVVIGKLIVRHIKAVGLKVRWSGSAAQSIKVSA